MSETEKPLETKRAEEFISLYANNAQFEASVWDLKILFGQLDQALSVVDQHTAITMAWPHAKVAAYYMVVNLIIHQARNGHVDLPPSVVPPRPDPLDPALDEPFRKTAKYLAWVHDQFFSDTPFVPPDLEG